MNRRQFLQSTSATSAALLAFEPFHPSRKTFRTITYNILACRGYPKRPENETRLQHAQKQIPIRIAQELLLYEPDMVTFQESASEETMARIAEAMGMSYAYFPGGFPGTLMTRHAIIETQNCPLAGGAERPKELFTRHWGRATIVVGSRELIVYTVHLYPSDKGGYRVKEVAAMCEALEHDLVNGKSLILQGDLNFDPDSDEYETLTATGLEDAYTDEDPGFTISSTDLRKRIDLIFSHGAISKNVKSCRALAEGAFIDHADDPAGFALSDHIPVLAEFEI